MTMTEEEKGSKTNPYTMSEYEDLADKGQWKGGYVKDSAGTVSYMMSEVLVNGYSGSGSGSHGSDFQFGSYKSLSGDNMDDDDNDKDCDEYEGIPSVNGSANTGTDNDTDVGGGGGSHFSVSNVNDGNNGTFLNGAAYFTEKEYSQMCENGTWIGGNIYTLGYVGKDCVINPCLTSIDSDDYWLTLFKNKASAVRNGMKELGNKIMSLPYIQAISRYNAATSSPLYFDTKSLGLEDLRGYIYKHNKEGKITGINLLDVQNLQKLLKGKSLYEQAVVLSTALTLGNITLIRTSDGVYTVQKDEYNFDMHNSKDESIRNVSTVIGFSVSEGLSIMIDTATANVFGSLIFPQGLFDATYLARHLFTSIYLEQSKWKR